MTVNGLARRIDAGISRSVASGLPRTEAARSCSRRRGSRIPLLARDLSMNFGGVKQSGIGRAGTGERQLPFLKTKSMIFESLPDTLVRSEG